MKNLMFKMTLAVVASLVAAVGSAKNYTVGGTAASFGKVTFPSTFSGYVTSAVGTSGGMWNTFTFTPKAGGTRSVTVTPTLRFGDTHTVRTQLYRGTADLVATFNGSGSKSVSFESGQYYTVKVQMISPSYYTTTVYDYTVSVGGGSGGGSDDSSGIPKLEPPTPSASQGKYAYVKVSWSKVSGCKGYVIKRGTSSSYSQAIQLAKISKASTKSFKDTSARKGTVYYYWVCPLATSTTFWYNTGRYASGYVKGTASGGSGGSTSGAYISGSTKVTFKANGTTSAYYLYVGGKKITSGVTWTKSGSGVTLSKSGGGAKLKMTTRPSGSYNVIYLNANYKNTNYKKSVYIYR